LLKYHQTVERQSHDKEDGEMNSLYAPDAGSTQTQGDRPPVVIKGTGVGKTFGNGSVVALHNASFEIRQGSFVSLVGPSGCGKSTLLRLIAGLIDRTSGNLLVHDTPVSGPHTDVGMMFQRATLLDWRTSLENVLLPTEVTRTPTQADKQRAAELLRLVGLKDFLFAFPSQLSGGMQQRVALARLLQTGADILLLEEPFGALDEFTRDRLNIELMRIVTEVRATTLFVTHNIAEAIFLADQVFVMTPRPGRIVEIVDVPFERPRPLSIQTSPEFNTLVAKVRDILGDDH
jgi:NitT/TauT family transport system ATP-binding protein